MLLLDLCFVAYGVVPLPLSFGKALLSSIVVATIIAECLLNVVRYKLVPALLRTVHSQC